MYAIVVRHIDDTSLMEEVVLIDEIGFLFFWSRVIFLLIKFQFGGWFGVVVWVFAFVLYIYLCAKIWWLGVVDRFSKSREKRDGVWVVV